MKDFKKRSIALTLSAAMLLWSIPAGVYSASETAASQGDESDKIAADGQVVVLYENGQVDSEAPATRSEKKSAQSARKAKSFGQAMEKADEEAASAENTLGQQADILADSLGDDYVIEDTIVFEPAESEAEEAVVSVISSDKYSAEEMIDKLADNDKVKAAEPNYIFHASGMPDWNDTYIDDTWQNGSRGINADKAWSRSDFDSAEEPVVIAVLDTGIDYEHPDLKDRMWTRPEEFKLKGEHGMDFVYNDEDPMDENGHGSHCAGIIAASADNAEGVAGAAGKAEKLQLMAVRVLDEEGSGYLEDIVSAYYYMIRAKKAGANLKAVNVSLGASVSSEVFDAVIDQAGENGILTIAAAGNEMSDNDEVPSAPANSKSDYVIAVAALDQDGSLASYSNYGRKNVDVAAPGSNILSTVCYDNYMPFLYGKDNLKATTEYYGEFGGAEIASETGADGEEITKVTPVSGSDYFGDAITDVGTFGESVMLASRVEGSEGKASLELTDPSDDDAFPIGNNKTALRWKITGAKEGDVYVLYFPYEKMASGDDDTYTNMVVRTHTEADGGYGQLELGDVIAYVDKNGDLSYRTIASESWFGYVLPVSEDWNSIWQASGSLGMLYPHKEVKGLANNMTELYAEPDAELDGDADSGAEESVPEEYNGYGLGMVYTAAEDGDVYIDLSSIAISKVKADEKLFGKYDVYSGTSMATPVVTGAVALIAGMNPDMSAEEIRDKLYATTGDGYRSVCSTGGAVDFAHYSSDPGSSKPVIGDAKVNFDAKKVTLSDKNAGANPSVTATFNYQEKTVTIDAADISVSDGSIVIADKYGLIGSDVTFTIVNPDTGLSGQRTFYLIKGLKAYSEMFTMDLTEESDDYDDLNKGGRTSALIEDDDYFDDEDMEEDNSFPPGLTYLKGTDRTLLYDENNIYELAKKKSGDGYKVSVIGDTFSEAVRQYALSMVKKNELWAPNGYDPKKVERDENGNEILPEYFTVSAIGNPVYRDEIVYQLVNADLRDREADLILGLNLGNGKWKVYYDSLSDFGTACSGLSFSKIEAPVLAAYKGSLYLIGNISEQEGEAASTEVFTCTPKNNGADWTRAAEINADSAGGKAIGQGGNLYYFLGRNSDYEIDYNIYKYDGSSWSVAGKLPPAMYKDGADPMMLLFADTALGDTVSCAYGIDDKGIVFGGASFDGAGDTFRFNTSTGKIDQLGYSLWGGLCDRATDGTVAGGRLIVQYESAEGDKVIAKSIPVRSGYVKVTVKVSGKGSGTVSGTRSRPIGEASNIAVTPGRGSYIYAISSKGLAPELSRSFKKSTSASRSALRSTFKAGGNATINVHFGKVSTKITVQKIKRVKVGKKKIKAYTDGTISGVKWKSSNKKYAKVNKNGTITFKKAGRGKTVKLTAISVENPKIKKTIKVKIKK